MPSLAFALADDPPNCYQEFAHGAWSLKYNDGANTGNCAQKDQCLCYGAQPPSSPPTPPSPPPPRYPPAPPAVLMHLVSGSNFCERITMASGPFVGAECLTDGSGNYGANERCKAIVMSSVLVTVPEYFVEECASGCDYLTLDGIRYQHNDAPVDVPLDAGAVIEWRSDNANERAGFTLCAKPDANPKTPPPTPLPPPPPPYLPNQRPVSVFHLREYGACPAGQIVDTIEQCNAAATSLSLADTSAEADGQVAYHEDPPWCYYESGVLKFNVGGTNTGSCSATDKCVCEGVQSPAPPPPPPPPSAPLTSSFSITSGSAHCHFTSSPPRFGGQFDCVTDGPGYHENREECEILIMRDTRLVSIEYLVEAGFDYLEIGGTKHRDAGFDGQIARVGDVIKWHTDAAVVSPGFTICAENLPPPSPPPTPPPSPPPPSPAAPGGTSLPAVTMVTTVDVGGVGQFDANAYAISLATLVGVPVSDVTVTVSSRRQLLLSLSEQHQPHQPHQPHRSHRSQRSQRSQPPHGRTLATVTVTAQILTPDAAKATSVEALLNGKTPAQLSADLGVTVTSIAPTTRQAIVVFPPPSPMPSPPPPVPPLLPPLAGGGLAQSVSERAGPSTGTLVGAVVGGVAGLALIGVAVFRMRRHFARQGTTKMVGVGGFVDDIGESSTTTRSHAHAVETTEYAVESLELDDIETKI